MKLFKKYSLVPTGNIKQYMIDEFRRANELEISNRDKDDKILDLQKENKDKDDKLAKASILLEQFKYKIGKAKENYDNDLDKYKRKITKLEKELYNAKEEANTYQIKIIEQKKIIDELKKEVKNKSRKEKQVR